MAEGTKRRFGALAVAGAALTLLSAEAASAARKVTGTIKDRGGRPVAGLDVRVWDVNPGVGTNVLIGKGQTDPQGAFSIQYDDYRDPGPGPNPDIRVTVETRARYATGNWFDVPGSATFGTKTTTDDAGETTILAWWPGFNHQANDWDPRRDITIPPGMLTVERNVWEAVRTTFDPLVHGFRFGNPKRSICWGPTCRPPWGDMFRTRQTLCGGMSLTALKKYVAGRCDTYSRYGEVPDDNEDGDRLPADLKEEIVTDQINTFVFDPYSRAGSLDGMLNDLQRFPPPAPALRFLEWQAKQEEPGGHPGPTIGAATKDQWPLIREHIKSRKLPVVLGLVHSKAAPLNIFDFDLVSGNHQVLAIGYDYSPHYRTATLYVYDPNYPEQIRELRFKEQLRHSRMYVDYDARKTRGFFLNVRVPDGIRAPRAACPPPPRRQDLQLSRLEVRDATAHDLARPVAGVPLRAFAQVRNAGDDHISGQVALECGTGPAGAVISSLPHSAHASVQLKKRRPRTDGGWSYSQDWVSVGLPALPSGEAHAVKCRATVVSERGDTNLEGNTRQDQVTAEPAGTTLGAPRITVKSPAWRPVPALPFDRGLTVTVENAGRFMPHPEGGSEIHLRCTAPLVPWAFVVAAPDAGTPFTIRNASLGIPSPGRSADVELLLHGVTRPPFPGPHKLARDMLLDCTAYLGRLHHLPVEDGRPPAPPGGLILSKENALLRFTNNEAETP